MQTHYELRLYNGTVNGALGWRWFDTKNRQFTGPKFKRQREANNWMADRTPCVEITVDSGTKEDATS